MATCVCSSCPKTNRPAAISGGIPCYKNRCPQIDTTVPNSRRPRLPDLPPPFPISDDGDDDVWSTIRREAVSDAESEPILKQFYSHSILSHATLESSLASHLAGRLTPVAAGAGIPAGDLGGLILAVMSEDPGIGRAVRADLRAARARDPACGAMAHCLLYHKGFLALAAHRVAHRLWVRRREAAALYVHGRAAEVFAVDIHPGARVGCGVLLDHATGVVVGETAVVGDDVSILHGVTLGGTGKEGGDRHPKVGDGVLIGAGAHILGNVRVGDGAKVGAGSVVLKPVPPGTTAVGNPARIVGGKQSPVALEDRPGITMDHTSWSDYVI